MVQLSFVIPVYNNEDSIRELTNQLYKLLNGVYQFEIVFVDDGSTDNSLERITSLSAVYSFVKLKKLCENGGQNNAIIEGLKKSTGEKIIVLDADLQDNLEMIFPLIDSLSNNVDTVYVLRKGKYQSNRRMFTSYLLKGSIQLIIGLPRKAGTFFIIRKKLIPRLIKLRFRFPYVTIMVFHVSGNVEYLYSIRNSNDGRSAYTFKKRLIHGIKAVSCAIQCRFLKNSK